MFRLFARKPEVSERRSFPLQFEDGARIEVALHRHPRARRIKLAVDERGACLTLPPRASERAALDFLHAHRDWLQAQWLRLQEAAATPLRVGETAMLPLRGVMLPLHWKSGRLTRLHRIDDALQLETRGLQAGDAPTPAVHRALRDFYEAEARSDIARWLPRYAPALPKSPTRLQLKRMRSQWGSLTPAGVVTLDLALVLARPAAFEYVLVHELCHLLQHNHSPAYWREVEARFPDWRDERDYLHAEGVRLKATLRELAG